MATYAYDTIVKFTSLLEDNLSYSKELKDGSNSSPEKPELKGIENSHNLLVQEGKKLKEKLKGLNLNDNYSQYPDDIRGEVDAFYQKIADLKKKITAFKENNPGLELPEHEGMLISDDVLKNLEMAETCRKEMFSVPRYQIEAKNDPETQRRRDDRIKNIQAIKENPEGNYRFDKLNQEEKNKYIAIINYWTENIKDKGFEANVDFLGYMEGREDKTGVELTEGEHAAVDALIYNIMVPRKADGSIDYEGTREMVDGSVFYSNKVAMDIGKKIESAAIDVIGVSPVVGNNLTDEEKAASKEYKKKRNENIKAISGAVLSSKEEYVFGKNRNFSGSLGQVLQNVPCGMKGNVSCSEYVMWSSSVIHSGLNKDEKKYVEMQESEYDGLKSDEATEEKAREFFDSDIYKIPGGPFNEPVKPVFDLNLSLEEKCYELNRICDKLLVTKNAYFGHSNSDNYTDMMESLMKIRKLSEDRLRTGEFFKGEEADKLREEVRGVSDKIRTYLNGSLKSSYSSENGEERSKLAFVAYDIVNPLAAEDYLAQHNQKLENDGYEPIKMADLKEEYNVEKGQLIKNIIDNSVNKANKSLPEGEKIDDNLKKMLQEPEALDDFKAMFDVKHHARIIRWNSSLYNKTKAALEEFVELRDQIRTDMLTDGKTSKEDMAELKDSYSKCQDLLKRYIAKSYGTEGEISDAIKRTAAGTARGVGAAGALSLFTGQKVNKMNKVQQTSLKNLFKEEMGRGLMNNSSDKKRKAASKAMDRYREKSGKNKTL